MFFLLYVLWLILNGRITLEICLIGLVVVSLIYLFMCKFMNFSVQKEIRFIRRAGYALAYLFVLLKEIFVANFHVIAIILIKRIPIHPSMTQVRINLRTDVAKTILANSITLTPGTITVKVEGDVFTVHCLSREMIEGIEESRFVKLLQKMEEDHA